MIHHGIRSKITRVFITQILLISLATVAGVYGSARVVENVLVKKALESEAEHFWALYEQNKTVAKPNTANLTGYLAIARDYSKVPQELHQVQTGYGRVALAAKHPSCMFRIIKRRVYFWYLMKNRFPIWLFILA